MARLKDRVQWERGTGYQECSIHITGERARRVHYHNPEAYDALVVKFFDEFYTELCKLPDPQIPKKEEKEKI